MLKVGYFVADRRHRPTLEVLDILFDGAEALDDFALIESLSGSRKRRLVN